MSYLLFYGRVIFSSFITWFSQKLTHSFLCFWYIWYNIHSTSINIKHKLYICSPGTKTSRIIVVDSVHLDSFFKYGWSIKTRRNSKQLFSVIFKSLSNWSNVIPFPSFKSFKCLFIAFRDSLWFFISLADIFPIKGYRILVDLMGGWGKLNLHSLFAFFLQVWECPWICLLP